MALIPIFFKADDINNVKKGHLRSQDLASFLSLMTLNKVGILDMLGSNPCGLKTDVSVSSGFATITLNAGYVSILGRLIYIEDGTRVEITLPNETQTGSFGIRVNLSESGSAECSWFTKTGNLQTDNIVDNPTGIYEFRLYDYTATSSTLTLTNKTTEMIVGLQTFMNSNNFETKNKEDNSNSIATTAFVHSLLKGRGLNIVQGNIMFGDNVVGVIYSQNYIVWGYIYSIPVAPANTVTESYMFDIPTEFAPFVNTIDLFKGCIAPVHNQVGSGDTKKIYLKDPYVTQTGKIGGIWKNGNGIVPFERYTTGFYFAYNRLGRME